MPTVLVELLGFVMVIAGVVVALRAIATVRADLVARWTGCTVDPELAALQVEKRRQQRDARTPPAEPTRTGTGTPDGDSKEPTGKVADLFRVKSFDENVAALNRRMGRRALNDEIRQRDDE